MYLDSKTLNKMGIGQMYLKYDKSTAHIILRNEKNENFYSKIRNCKDAQSYYT